jgi:dTDP-4-amino-4,6-dideoxygalactose transaminase
LFVIRVRDRQALQGHLADHGVATVVHYPTPVHLLGAYEDLGYRRGAFPETETHSGECLSLPMYPHLAEDQIDHVVAAIRSFFGAS